MAYFIFAKNIDQNNLYRIAQNDTDKNGLIFNEKTDTVKTVSDVDFNKVRESKATVNLESDSVVISDVSLNIPNENALKSNINIIIGICDNFLQKYDSNNSMYSAVSNYKNVLESFDTSSVSFPINKSWETYCSENSITYLNPLQIP